MPHRPTPSTSMDNNTGITEEHGRVLSSTTRCIVIDYETDPALSLQIAPKPITLHKDGLMRLILTNTTMQLDKGTSMEMGSGFIGAHGSCLSTEGTQTPGFFLINRPLTVETVIYKGLKSMNALQTIAEIPFTRSVQKIAARVSRLGITYIDFVGTIGNEFIPQADIDNTQDIAAFPIINNHGFVSNQVFKPQQDQPETIKRYQLNGELSLHESPIDTVADLPIKKVVNMVYEVRNNNNPKTSPKPITPW